MNILQSSQFPSMPRNLTLIAQPVYEGFSVLPATGPHVVQYLNRLISVVSAALEQSSKIFAVRVDLHLPLLFDGQPVYSNHVIESFIKSLKARIEVECHRRLNRQEYASDGQLRYVWAREQASAAQPHYHLLLIFNANFFQQLGRLDDQYGLASMIFKAWASALGQSLTLTRELVHFPDDPAYFVDRNNLRSQSLLLSRASYLCKSATKVWHDGLHAFGASRG